MAMRRRAKRLNPFLVRRNIHRPTPLRPRTVADCIADVDEDHLLVVPRPKMGGVGVVPIHPIPAFGYVCKYPGVLMSRVKALEQEKAHKPGKGCYMMCITYGKNEIWLDATHSVGKGRCINHSKQNPNVRAAVHHRNGGTQVVFQALAKGIKAGEDIEYDYNETDPVVLAALPFLSK
jgi:SET domain-containing protein